MRDINFFSPYQGKKKENINTQIYIYGAAVVVGLFILVTLCVNSYKMIYYKTSIAKYEAKLTDSDTKKKLDEAKVVNKKLEILNKYEHGITDISKNMNSRDVVTTKLLNSISATLPSDVYFKSIDVATSAINIKAMSKSRKAIGEIEHNLKNLSNIQDVYIGAISGDGALDGEYSFDIKCVLKEVK